MRSHNELLLGALEEGAVVPFRFGTTFPDRAALDEWLERHRASLAAELERLRGTAEWSVEPVGRVPDVDAAEYLGARLATTVRPGLRERLAAACEDAAGDAYLVAKSRQDEFGQPSPSSKPRATSCGSPARGRRTRSRACRERRPRRPLDSLVDTGVAAGGDVTISVAGVELIALRLKALLASVGTEGAADLAFPRRERRDPVRLFRRASTRTRIRSSGGSRNSCSCSSRSSVSCSSGRRCAAWRPGASATRSREARRAFLALHKRVDELYDELVGGEPEQRSLLRALG